MTTFIHSIRLEAAATVSFDVQNELASLNDEKRDTYWSLDIQGDPEWMRPMHWLSARVLGEDPFDTHVGQGADLLPPEGPIHAFTIQEWDLGTEFTSRSSDAGRRGRWSEADFNELAEALPWIRR